MLFVEEDAHLVCHLIVESENCILRICHSVIVNDSYSLRRVLAGLGNRIFRATSRDQTVEAVVGQSVCTLLQGVISFSCTSDWLSVATLLLLEVMEDSRRGMAFR